MNPPENAQQRAQRLADEWTRLILTHNPKILLGENISHSTINQRSGDREFDAKSVQGAARAVVEFHHSLTQLLSEKSA